MKRTSVLAINFDHVLFNNKELKDHIITLLSFADNQFLVSNRTSSDTRKAMRETATIAATQQDSNDLKKDIIKAAKCQSLSGINSMLATHGLKQSKFLVKGEEVKGVFSAEHLNLHEETARHFLESLIKKDDDSKFQGETTSGVYPQIVSDQGMIPSINSSPASAGADLKIILDYYDAVKVALSTPGAKNAAFDLVIIGNFFVNRTGATVTKIGANTISYINADVVKNLPTNVFSYGALRIGLHEYTQQLIAKKKLCGNVLKDLAALRYELQYNDYNDTNRKFALEFHRLYDLKLTKLQRSSLVTLEVTRFGETFKNEIDPPRIVRLKTEASTSITKQFSIICELKLKEALTLEILIMFIDNFYPCLTLANKNEFISKIFDEHSEGLIRIPLSEAIKDETEIKSTKKQVYALIRKTLLNKLSNQKVQNSSFLENCRQVADQVTWFPKGWIFGIIARVFLKPDYSHNLQNITYKSRPTCLNFEEFRNSASVFLKRIQDSLSLTIKNLITDEKITIFKDHAKPIVSAPKQLPLKIITISKYDSRYHFFNQHFSNLTWAEQRKLYTQTAIYKNNH